MEQATSAATEPKAVAAYDFHDPSFVTWWLDSLYLFPFEEQVAIARLLRSAVHAPDSRQEIDAFLELRTTESQADALLTAGRSEALLAETSPVWHGQLRSSWRGRPWLTAAGVLAVLYFVGKGVWFLLMR